MCLAVPVLPDFLHPLKHFLVNDGLMGVGEDCLLLSRIFPLLLIPNGVGVGLEIDGTAGVLPPFKNVDYGAGVPVVGIFW